jgi:glycosyltransferase involved in cell wall biosynthesis
MTRQLRIVHIIHALGPGGAEHTLVDLAREAPDHSIDLHVVSLMDFGAHPYPRQLRALGAGVHSLGLPSRWDPRSLGRGLRLVRDLEPDAVHSHLKHADLVAAWVAWRLDLPMISTLHVIEDAPTTIGRFKRLMAGQARLRIASRTVAVSEALRRWYLETFNADPARVVRIPNGVHRPALVADRTTVRESLGVRHDAVVATMVGIMRPDKGHQQLIAAVAQLQSGADVQFVLLGDGPLRSEFEAQAVDLGLTSDRLIFAGFREDVPDILAASDLVVHPSLDDALPTALLHALGAGTPVVASDTGGIPEIIDSEVGMLVPPGQVDELVAALQELIELLPSPTMTAAAKARFENEFAASIWASRLRNLYEEVVAERS